MSDLDALLADLPERLAALPPRDRTKRPPEPDRVAVDGPMGDEPPLVGDGEPPTPASEADEPIDWEMLRACAAEPETDVGNGRRLLHRSRKDMLWIRRIGWHVYDKRRWGEDVEQGAVRPLCHAAAEAIGEEALVIKADEDQQVIIADGEAAATELEMLPPPEEKDAKAKAEHKAKQKRLYERVDAGTEVKAEIRKMRSARKGHGKSSASTNRLNNMLTEAQAYVSHALDDLDADPMAINLENGTLRVTKDDKAGWGFKLHEHAREDLISKLMPVAYDPAAECPQFETFMETVVPDEDVRAFLQRFFGYSITALTVEQVLVFFYGRGRNGKSTLVDLLARIMGDYSASLPFETLAGDDRRKGGDATPDLVRIPGARMVRAAEPEQKMKFREAMLKSLTSSEPILVRPLHGGFNEVYPTFKLVISGNHKPGIEGSDDGIWRRLLLVPWDTQIDKDNVDRDLPDKLWREAPGVLNWMLAGLLSYLEQGLGVPETVRAATSEYREESDPVGAFIRAALNLDSDDSVTTTPGDLVEAFTIWSRQQGLNAWNPTTFTRRFAKDCDAHGIRKAKSNGNTLYRGCSVKLEFTKAFDDAQAMQDRA